MVTERVVSTECSVKTPLSSPPSLLLLIRSGTDVLYHPQASHTRNKVKNSFIGREALQYMGSVINA